MQKKSLFLLLVLFMGWFGCRADEGMWIPLLLKKYNIEDMQAKGFKLTAEDVYHINKASLKDAVIGLGREGRPFFHFCTAELISDEGLVLTNHHCAFGMIQEHSNLDKNYLRDGFWAKTKKDELSSPGITASILVRMEDVTDKIMSELKSNMTVDERNNKITEISKKLEQEAVKGSTLMANIKPYFNGNQYFMSVFKIYKDVRLVGAPPSAIGKFGGDTDNWMWPRHTGDFTLLRIYADEKNEPLAYSPENIPYKPDTFFKISTKEINEGDFTMVFGYPGTTKEYLPSFAVEELVNIEYPHKIGIRTAKLNVINAAMESDDLLRIKYAAKAASVANAWKKWQGEIKGLERFKTVSKKQQEEEKFQVWATNNEKYNRILSQYKKLYRDRERLVLAQSYVDEAGKRGAEIIGWSASVSNLLKSKEKLQDIEKLRSDLKSASMAFYKNYDLATDKKILVEMLKLYSQNLPMEWIPTEIQKASKKGIEKYVDHLFSNSIFADQEALEKLMNKVDQETYKKLKKDPALVLFASIDQLYLEKIQKTASTINSEITQLNKIWLAALMEMQDEKTFYPDANSTLRVAYGEIDGYSPRDAVYYTHFTTLKGIMEKDNPKIYDYNIPQKLREIYQKRDFGNYTQAGEVPVCFIANNHSTGGNSGSPVLNAEGHLIGLNFDRAWDGVMSDIQYDPEICRNISVDIRYVLFIIDKLANADHLIDEMVIVK